MEGVGLLMKGGRCDALTRKKPQHPVSQISGQIWSTHLRKTSKWQTNVAAVRCLKSLAAPNPCQLLPFCSCLTHFRLTTLPSAPWSLWGSGVKCIRGSA